jgi:hypothetical protein
MKSIWIANYNGVEIRIENSWLKGESLYVDGNLQDQQMNAFSSVLTGKIQTSESDKSIMANLGGFFSVNCRLFVDNELIEIKKIK